MGNEASKPKAAKSASKAKRTATSSSSRRPETSAMASASTSTDFRQLLLVPHVDLFRIVGKVHTRLLRRAPLRILESMSSRKERMAFMTVDGEAEDLTVRFALDKHVVFRRADASSFVIAAPGHVYGIVVKERKHAAYVTEKLRLKLKRFCTMARQEDGSESSSDDDDSSYASSSSASSSASASEAKTEDASGFVRLVRGATKVTAAGIVGSATLVGRGILAGGKALAGAGGKRMEKKDVAVPVAVRHGSAQLQFGSDKVVRVADAAVDKMAEQSALFLASLAERAGALDEDEDKSRRASTTRRVATTTARETVTVLVELSDALSRATDILLDDSTQASVHVVSAKFGDDAGDVTGDVLGTGRNVLKLRDAARPKKAGKRLAGSTVAHTSSEVERRQRKRGSSRKT